MLSYRYIVRGEATMLLQADARQANVKFSVPVAIRTYSPHDALFANK